MEVNVKEVSSEEESTPPLPSFGPHPDTTKDYTFLDKVAKLPYKFNLGDVPFSKEQQDDFLNLVYDHQKVFLLHDEDLGFCNNWPIQYQSQLTSLYICLTGQLHDNFKVRLENALICGSDKATSDNQRAHMITSCHCEKKMERFDFVLTTRS